LPLLDKDIINFAFGIDVSLKKDKYILRKAVENLLPQDIVWRKKQGFGTPYIEWMMSDKMLSHVLECLNSGKLLTEICDQDALVKMVNLVLNAHESPKVASLSPMNVVWNLFALQVWSDTWFKR